MKTSRNFDYQGVELRITGVERPLDSNRTYLATVVVAPNGLQLPISANHKEPIASFKQRAIDYLINTNTKPEQLW